VAIRQSGMRMNLWLLSLLAAAFSLLAGAGATSWWEDHPDSRRRSRQTTADAPKPRDPDAIILTPTDLLKAYGANEVAADIAYKDLELQVTGRVASVRRDASGSIVVQLNPLEQSSGVDGVRSMLWRTDEFVRVVALLEAGQESDAAALKQDSYVVLSCIGDGAKNSAPTLRDCIVKHR